MSKKVVFLFVFIFLVSFVAASDVAYIYKSESKIDSNVVDILLSLGLDVDYVSQSQISDLSKYRFIIVGDEYFTEDIPITNYRSIVMNYYLGEESGLTNRNGVSQISSVTPLEVNVKGNDLVIYTSERDLRGKYLAYYFLANENKASELDSYAKTFSVSSGKAGDVISFAPKGIELSNGQTTQGEICFFGIIKSDYWTDDARELFNDCINFVNIAEDNNEIENNLSDNSNNALNQTNSSTGTPSENSDSSDLNSGDSEDSSSSGSSISTSSGSGTESSLSNSGSGTRFCSTDWVCSEWSICHNGKQTRTCSYPANFCTPEYEKPVESQICTEVKEDLSNSYSGSNGTIQDSQANKLTGRAIDDISDIIFGKYSWLIFFIVLILAILFFFLLFKKKDK